MQRFGIIYLPVLVAACIPSQDSEQIEDLLSGRTLEEKVGQLNMYMGRWEMTGPAPDNEWAQAAADKLESGEPGSMLNVVGAEARFKIQ